MRSKKIYLIRHGQTDFNKNGMVQGSGVDAPLNETGRKQAESFYQSYRNMAFDKVYISALQRTFQSVHKFIKEENLPYEILPDLNEISWGEKEGQSFSGHDHNHYLSVTESWRSGQVDLAIGGGESPVEVKDRVSSAFDYILSKPDEEKILVCMHGRAIRILLCHLLNFHLRHMDIFPHANLCLYELTYTGSLLSLDNFNDIQHLNGHAGSNHHT
ncbi:histidine phosphatase family protein [Fulvivirgaceae bacterium BMA10]|uniref:Histidine phosphatase family protein n=1 Tax=Splendidivirga corallicola TaxID=3051826 RepID=A0ABT8KR73_9BACT|nr:histidine phosphatase family protein [Fulvivirgaceae bacterium BMA10]